MTGRVPRVAACVLVLAALAAACAGDGERTAPAPTERDVPTETTTTTTTTTTTAAPEVTTPVEDEGGPLVVAEQGFSVFPDPVDPRANLGGYGVVIENWDTELLAAGVGVTVRLLDAEGNELLAATSLLNGIGPAQRMATGRTVIEPIEHPAAMTVELSVTAWLPPLAEGPALTSSEVTTEVDDGGGMVTTFRASSEWPRDEEGVDAAAVYRGEDDRILAAEVTTLARVRAGSTVEGRIELLAPIPDLRRTEIHLGRGFAALTAG